MTLFEECLQALENKVKVLSSEETNTKFKMFTKLFKMTPWGRID